MQALTPTETFLIIILRPIYHSSLFILIFIVVVVVVEIYSLEDDTVMKGTPN